MRSCQAPSLVSAAREGAWCVDGCRSWLALLYIKGVAAWGEVACFVGHLGQTILKSAQRFCLFANKVVYLHDSQKKIHADSPYIQFPARFGLWPVRAFGHTFCLYGRRSGHSHHACRRAYLSAFWHPSRRSLAGFGRERGRPRVAAALSVRLRALWHTGKRQPSAHGAAGTNRDGARSTAVWRKVTACMECGHHGTRWRAGLHSPGG